MRRLWREFRAAFWAAYDEASGNAQRRRDREAQLAQAQRELAERMAAYRRDARTLAEAARRRADQVQAQLVDDAAILAALVQAKTDGRVH